LITKIRIYYLIYYYHILLKKHGIKYVCNKINSENKNIIFKKESLSIEEIMCICSDIERIRASHVLKEKALCLHRSLVGFKLLREKGVDVNLCIGVAKRDFEAHAWLVYEDLIINDSESYVNDNFNMIFQI
jgi:Transglutaminase-like superfamily